ncbi:Glycylpeptide N-tetradecanoyltransferase 2 [Irineochytrium annulatum]|nr:Glycylpeptide N-tetradecanoyltransferase 2 [Irineochytrium annulatum]
MPNNEPTTSQPRPADEEEDDDDQPDPAMVDGSAPSTAGAKKKKKNKKKPAAASSLDASSSKNATASASNGVVSQGAKPGEGDFERKLREVVDKLGGAGLLDPTPVRSNKELKDMGDYKFWSTQPVPRTDEMVLKDGPIEADKLPEEIQKEPYELKGDFEWSTVDIEQADQKKEVYELLTLNYVEDDDAMFRFDYSAEFIQWALKPPGWKKVWHRGVRVKSNKKLVAFISAIPADLRVHSVEQHLVEINFLCVHKKLRQKRLAPVLIKEITRLVHLEGIFQAVYTAGAVLPKAISTCRYYHRSINYKKLVETGFSQLPSNKKMSTMIKLYALPEKQILLGTRPMEERDVPHVHKLMRQYLSRFDVSVIMSEEEVKHWLMPLPGVVFSCVVEDPGSGEITDFYSFYSLPSSAIGNKLHTHINAAYLFYYAPKDMGENKSRVHALLKDALILARNNGFDVFNCLNLMANDVFLEELKFGKGDGNLYYYLYNYRCREVEHGQMGLVML